MLGLANTDTAPEVVDNRSQVADQASLLGADSLGDAIVTDMMLRPFRDSRERTRVRTELPSQPYDAVNAWHLPVPMPGGVVEAEADPAGEFVEENVPAALAAPRTLEPR